MEVRKRDVLGLFAWHRYTASHASYGVGAGSGFYFVHSNIGFGAGNFAVGDAGIGNDGGIARDRYGRWNCGVGQRDGRDSAEDSGWRRALAEVHGS